MLFPLQRLQSLLKPGAHYWIVGRRLKCQVIISSSQSIFDNLALEDYLYENRDNDLEERTLLVWRNKPCVVIGKFQNQWLECSHSFLRKHSIPLGEI